MVAANPKTVLVLINGGPLAIEAEAASVPAIVECFYPGQLGGEAIVDALMGDVNVFGKMPYTTYYRNYTSRRDIREGDLRVGSGTTYWWMKDPVLFPFGSGLEYTTFSFAWAVQPPPPPAAPVPPSAAVVVETIPDRPAELLIEHRVVVTNTGPRASPGPTSPLQTPPARPVFGLLLFGLLCVSMGFLRDDERGSFRE